MAEKDNTLLCQFCWLGSEVEIASGQLHAEKTKSGKFISAHHRCMQYASGLTQYKSQEFGGFDICEVEKEINRGSKLRCSICKNIKGRKSIGAACGCAVKSCRKTFHFTCAHGDDSAVTKRLVVTRNRNNSKEKFVLYRVFCSTDHEDVFRKKLKEDLRSKSGSSWRDNEEDITGCDSKLDHDSSLSNSFSSRSHLSQTNDTSANHSRSTSPSEATAEKAFASPVLVSTPKEKNINIASAAVTKESMKEDHGETDESDRTESAPLVLGLKPQNGNRRRSALFQPKSQRVHVSQPPSCSLIEEMSNSCKITDNSDSYTSAASDVATKQALDKPEIQQGALTNAAASVNHNVSPGMESTENKSPNIPRMSPRIHADMTKSSTTCFVSLENKIRLPDKPVCKLVGESPGKTGSKSAVYSPVRTRSPSSSSLNGVFKAPEASPIKAVAALQFNSLKSSLENPSRSQKSHDIAINSSKSPNPVEGRIVEASPTAGINCSQPLNSKRSPAQTTPRKAVRDAQRSSPSEPPGSSQVIQVSSPENRSLSQSSLAEDDCTESPSDWYSSTELSIFSPPPSKQRQNGNKEKIRPNVLNVSDVTKDFDSTAVGNASCAAVSEAGDAPGERSSRKRRASGMKDLSSSESPSYKISKRNEDSTYLSQACILLIPSNMDRFKIFKTQLMEMALKVLDVKADNVCIWQEINPQDMPSHVLLFYMLDLLTELRNGNSEAQLKLLFDGKYLLERMNTYRIQGQIFQDLREEEALKDVEVALWASVEKLAKKLQMVRVLRPNGANLLALAVDFRTCKDSMRLLPYLQAYKGLFRWKENTVAAVFQMSPEDQQVAAEKEARTLRIWLTKTISVTDVIVLPVDEILLDKGRLETSPAFTRLVQSLRDKTNTAETVSEGEELHGDEAVKSGVPLLIFQPVDFNVLSFPVYYKKACIDFFLTQEPARFLTLVPLCNLHSSNSEFISMLMNGGMSAGMNWSTSVVSAFCPQTHATTLVLLEISASASPTEPRTRGSEIKPESATDTSMKRKRGRPRKHPAV